MMVELSGEVLAIIFKNETNGYTICDMAVSDEDSAFSCIKEIETGAGIIIAKAIELPTIDVKIRLMGI